MNNNGKTGTNRYEALEDYAVKSTKKEKKESEAAAATKALEDGKIKKALKGLIKMDVDRGVNYDFNNKTQQGYVIDAINQQTDISKKNIQKFILDELSKNTNQVYKNANPNHVSIFDKYRAESVKEKSEEIKKIRAQEPVLKSINNIINAAHKIKSEYGTEGYFDNLIDVITDNLPNEEYYKNFSNTRKSKIKQVIVADVMLNLANITDTIDIDNFGDPTFDFGEEILKGSKAIKTIENIEKKDVKGKPAFFEYLKMAIPSLAVFKILELIPSADAQGGKPTTSTTTSTTTTTALTTTGAPTITTSTTSQPTTSTTTSTTTTTALTTTGAPTITTSTIPTTTTALTTTGAPTITTSTIPTTTTSTTSQPTTTATTHTPTPPENPYSREPYYSLPITNNTQYGNTNYSNQSYTSNPNPQIADRNAAAANNVLDYGLGIGIPLGLIAGSVFTALLIKYYRKRNYDNIAVENNTKYLSNMQLAERIDNGHREVDSYIEQKNLFDKKIDALIKGLKEEIKTIYRNGQPINKLSTEDKEKEKNLTFLENLKNEFSLFEENGHHNNKNSINYEYLNNTLGKCKTINSQTNPNVTFSPDDSVINLDPVSKNEQVDNFKKLILGVKQEGAIEVPLQFFNKGYNDKNHPNTTHPINWSIAQEILRSPSPVLDADNFKKEREENQKSLNNFSESFSLKEEGEVKNHKEREESEKNRVINKVLKEKKTPIGQNELGWNGFTSTDPNAVNYDIGGYVPAGLKPLKNAWRINDLSQDYSTNLSKQQKPKLNNTTKIRSNKEGFFMNEHSNKGDPFSIATTQGHGF